MEFSQSHVSIRNDYRAFETHHLRYHHQDHHFQQNDATIDRCRARGALLLAVPDDAATAKQEYVATGTASSRGMSPAQSASE